MMPFDIDHPAVDAGVEALFGHHPERGGQERRQAVFAVLTAALPHLPASPTPGLQVDVQAGRCFVVFDGAPGHRAPSFVEVEDAEGNGLKVNWRRREDGYWDLGPFVPLVERASGPTDIDADDYPDS